MSLSSPLSVHLLRRLRRAGARTGASLAVMLVLASLLGMLHAVGHPAERLLAQSTRVSADRFAAIRGSLTQSVALRTGDAAAPSWLDLLFDHQANDRDCLIFDQLCHGPGAPAAAMLALGFALPTAAALMTLQGETIARWSALFQARGPPDHA